MNVETLRLLLIFFFVAIFLVAVSYLYQRKMSLWAYAFWGIFALLLPAIGPFFVIAYRPGEWKPRRRNRRKLSLMRRGYIRK